MSILLTVKGQRLYTQTSETDALQRATPERRFLHVLPKLLLRGDELEALGRRRAKLSVSSEVLGSAVLPRSNVIVRRPYRNGRYLIGGSKTTALGWLVELPPDLSTIDLRFSWTVPLLSPDFDDNTLFVIHDFALSLEGTAGTKTSDLFTMDTTPWPDHEKWFGELPPLSFSPFAMIGTRELQGSRKIKVLKGDDYGDTTHIAETLVIPAISLALFSNLRGLGSS